MIERVTGFARHSFPIRYLGFPLFFGRCKVSYFGGLSQSVLGRIVSWKSKFLSIGGRITLIRHVLSAIPVHLLSAVVIPQEVFKVLERVCAKFLWGVSEDGSKFHWVRWSHLCYPIEEGGVAFRRPRDVYAAFSCKLWWNF